MPRLDKYLVDEGYFESRNRALEAIKSGIVKVGGKKVKPSLDVGCDDDIVVEQQKFYISRAARKLEGFLATTLVAIEGKRVLDVGSSTGGFAQIVLEHNPQSIVCVDVGDNQLHHTLRKQPKLRLFENQDIRDFTHEPFELIVCDVSFISVLYIWEALERLLEPNGEMVILYKPQFEVGKEALRNSKGVVIDADAIAHVQRGFEAHLKERGFELIAKAKAAVAGKEGNEEYCYYLRRVQ